MRKWFVFLLAALLLCACGAQPTFETVDDEDSLLVSASNREVELELPKEAAKPTMESADNGSLYLCNGYVLTIQTFSGGDLNRTMQQLTGYTQPQLQYIRRKTANADKYELVWSAAGEGGDQVARAVILDDGQNHYAVTVMADADTAGQLQSTWQKLLGSVKLGTD